MNLKLWLSSGFRVYGVNAITVGKTSASDGPYCGVHLVYASTRFRTSCSPGRHTLNPCRTLYAALKATCNNCNDQTPQPVTDLPEQHSVALFIEPGQLSHLIACLSLLTTANSF